MAVTTGVVGQEEQAGSSAFHCALGLMLQPGVEAKAQGCWPLSGGCTGRVRAGTLGTLTCHLSKPPLSWATHATQEAVWTAPSSSSRTRARGPSCYLLMIISENCVSLIGSHCHCKQSRHTVEAKRRGLLRVLSVRGWAVFLSQVCVYKVRQVCCAAVKNRVTHAHALQQPGFFCLFFVCLFC